VVLKLLQDLEPKDVAAQTRLSLSTVYKIRRKSRATPVQWRQQRHEQLLLAALHDLQGIALFPARDPDLQTWLARPEEQRWPIPRDTFGRTNMESCQSTCWQRTSPNGNVFAST